MITSSTRKGPRDDSYWLAPCRVAMLYHCHLSGGHKPPLEPRDWELPYYGPP